MSRSARRKIAGGKGTAYEFHDSLKPNVTTGLYTVTVAHQMEVDDTGYFDNPAIRTLDVRAPRFTLPADAVHAVYPANGCVGTFDQILPHITLDRPPLPWENTISKHDEDVTWLALLVFATGELSNDPEATGATTMRTVDDLLNTDREEAIGPYIDTAVQPELLSTTCQTIDVPGKLFDQIAPQYNELNFLVHLRRGEDDASSVRALFASSQTRSLRGFTRKNTLKGYREKDDSRYAGLHAVVIGNRFPTEGGGQYAVHLVSLEGFRPYVRRDQVEQNKPLRMVSLHAWTYRSLRDCGPHFGALMERLAKAGNTDPNVTPSQVDPMKLTLRLDPDKAQGEAKDRFSRGYVPVIYRLRSGEQTYAWYRGPLTAQPAQSVPTPLTPAISVTSDTLLIYLQEHGLFDISYAAAWNLGKSLALADAAFASSLMKWRGTTRRLLGRTLIAHAQPGHGSLLAAAVRGLSSAAAIGPRPVRDRFEGSVKGGLADRLTQALAKPVPPYDKAAQKSAEDSKVTSPIKTLKSIARDKKLRDAIRAAAEDPSPLDWLDRLALLYPVPFDHLVSDGRLLPNESLRFFHVDRNWQTALICGALSIGVATSSDADLTALLHHVLADTPSAMSGFVVRSALVPSWPSL